MLGKVNILCAMRDRRAAEVLGLELDDGERCTMQVVSDGLQAWACIRSLAPDILVVDAVLPGLDGLGLVERMQAMLGDHMPQVIGGAMMPLAAEGFRRLGVQAVVRVPWQRGELLGAVNEAMEAVQSGVNWEELQAPYDRACMLLRRMGMNDGLKGFAYLAWAAALSYANEARLFAVGKRLYAPIAERFETTPQNVERLIRHAVESTIDAGHAQGIYDVFGNTIDPARGKPTNAQTIGLLVQRMRVL